MTAPPGRVAEASPADTWGRIDIYLFDQILRERFRPGMSILDAGCGAGRNLVFFLRHGYDVYGVDRNPAAVDKVRALASRLAPALPLDHFRVEEIGRLSFPAHSMDAVISNAVLHFAEDEAAFQAMVTDMWRLLPPGGILFCRTASVTGIEDRIRPLGDRRALLPDGTERFLVDDAFLVSLTDTLGGSLLDPIKTVNVQGQRCMATWCLRKHP